MAPTVALHVLHAGGALDGNAAGIETDALADKGNRLIAALAAIPAHDHGPSGLRRTLSDAEQRAHSEFRHGLDVEYLDVDAELAELAGAARELHGIEYVRRLIHEFACHDDAIDDVRVRSKGLSRGGYIADGERDVRVQSGIFAVFLLGLVAVEFIGAQPYPRCNRGRLIRLHLPRRQFRDDRHGVCAGAQFAGCRTAKLEKIPVLDGRELAGADHNQA